MSIFERDDALSTLSVAEGSQAQGKVDSTGAIWVHALSGSAAGDLGKAEDAAHTTGDVGVAALTVRKNTAAATSDTDGDYQPLITDTNGRLHVIEPSAAGSATSLALIDDLVSSTGSSAACKSVAMEGEVTATSNGANTIAAAGDYAANDIISNSATNDAGRAWKFTGLARVASGTGTLLEAKIETSVAAFAPRTRWFLFNADPTATERDDNAAFGANGEINSADRAKFLCRFDLPAMVDNGDQSWADLSGINRFYQGDASGDVYAIIILLDAATNESANMSVWPTLRVIRD